MEEQAKCPWCGHNRCPQCQKDLWPELHDGCCQCKAILTQRLGQQANTKEDMDESNPRSFKRV